MVRTLDARREAAAPLVLSSLAGSPNLLQAIEPRDQLKEQPPKTNMGAHASTASRLPGRRPHRQHVGDHFLGQRHVVDSIMRLDLPEGEGRGGGPVDNH